MLAGDMGPFTTASFASLRVGRQPINQFGQKCPGPWRNYRLGPCAVGEETLANEEETD